VTDRSTEHGFTFWGRSAEHGFTLIEMLVALTIFALLSMAGVALLRGGVSAQAQVRDHLDRLADVQVALAALDADLGQATVRNSRTESGTLAPAFFAAGVQEAEREPVMQFVRTGWSNPSGAPRPSVQKVEYWWRGGRIERVGYARIDGAAPDEPAVLLDGVKSVSVRFRNARGEWLNDWRPTQPDMLPRLVELTIGRGGGAPILLRFVVGPGGVEQQQDLQVPGG